MPRVDLVLARRLEQCIGAREQLQHLADQSSFQHATPQLANQPRGR